LFDADDGGFAGFACGNRNGEITVCHKNQHAVSRQSDCSRFLKIEVNTQGLNR
jgi:hypothetical protein